MCYHMRHACHHSQAHINIPLTGLSAATAPIRAPHQPARDHARRDRARVSHGRRGRRAAHPARCRNDPDRDRRLAPPHTAHSDPGPTDTHGPHIARVARAHATARARDALSAPCGALGGGSGRPTEPPPHPQHKDALHRRRPRVCGGGAARMATRAKRACARVRHAQRERSTPASRSRALDLKKCRQNELPMRKVDERGDGARPSIERRADGCMSVPA